MTTTDTLLLDILCHAIRGKHFKIDETLTPDVWQAVFDRAEEQKILPLVFEAVFPIILESPRELIVKYQRRALGWVRRQIVQTNEFLVMLHDMQAHGLDPIVMKGLVCRELYPQPMLRYSVDEDLLVDDSQFKAFHHALIDHGLQADDEELDFDKEYEISYHRPMSPLYVELHRRMFMSDQEAYGLSSSFFDNVHQRTITIQVQDVKVRSLHPTDHLAFLIFHAYKHFLYSGVGIRQVCDIGLFAEHYADQLDWTQIVRACANAHMGDFPTALFGIAGQYLGIHAAVPQEWRKKVDLLPLLHDMLSGGLMGNIDANRIHSSNITLGAVAAKGRHRSLAGIFQSLFPSASYIKKMFPYVSRYPFLLPIGWLHRIFNYMVSSKRDERLDALTTLKIGKERVELLRKYGVI